MLWVQSLAPQAVVEAVGTEVQGHPWLQGEFRDTWAKSAFTSEEKRKKIRKQCRGVARTPVSENVATATLKSSLVGPLVFF